MAEDGLFLVAGAGGFIGGHLAGALLAEGHAVRAVDAKPLDRWYQVFEGADNRQLDLSRRENCEAAAAGARRVYSLAADMGGMGYIERNKAACMLSVLVDTHLLLAARDQGVERFFYASSACVYPLERQSATEVRPLAEHEAYPAMPEDGYGWEKLFGERMCRHFYEDFGLPVRVARYHNVYGPHGTWDGGREKAPAAICRKVAQAELTGRHELEIWGDGEQRRSFTYIDDGIVGTELLVAGEFAEPMNVGSAQLVSINELVDIVEAIAGVSLKRRYRLDAPLGVRGRSSDNSLIRDTLGWEPSVSLEEGMERTYRWVRDQVRATG